MKQHEPSRIGGGGGGRLIEPIFRSELFRVYKQAFEAMSGLTLGLATANGVPLTGGDNCSPDTFCAQLPPGNPMCAGCSSIWTQTLPVGAEPHFRNHTCFAGLCESRVPIRVGTKVIGFLVAGRVPAGRPTTSGFELIAARLKSAGVVVDLLGLERAYFSTRATSAKRYESFLALLRVFASHLSLIANLLVLEQSGQGDAQILRACAFIHEHLSEPLQLGNVARSASLSACHFSKKFKESTGMTFTEYVATARIEAAKKLLTITGIRISEVAFEVGFQSLTHFNRVFREFTGLSPTRYRGSQGREALSPGSLCANNLTADL